jgi:signal transduction histidine kinase
MVFISCAKKAIAKPDSRGLCVFCEMDCKLQLEDFVLVLAQCLVSQRLEHVLEGEPMRTQSLNRADHLTKFSWRAARGLWLFLAAMMVALLVMFVYFFWYRMLIDPCSTNNFCQKTNTWYVPYGLSKTAWFVWEIIVFVVPAIIWMGLGIWVFFSRPRWVWGYAYSLFFMLGWYSEVSLQLDRLRIYDAVRLLVTSLTTMEFTEWKPVDAVVDVVRGILKMSADILIFLTVFTLPNGRFSSRWSKYIFWVFVPTAFFYSVLPFRYSLFNYMYWPVSIRTPFFLFLTVGLSAATVHRFVAGDPKTRVRLKGIAPSIVANILWYMFAYAYYNHLQFEWFPTGMNNQLNSIQASVDLLIRSINGVLMVWLAVTIIQSIVRHQLFDIRFVLNRTLVYGAMTLSSLTMYALIVGGLGSLFRQGEVWISVLATGVVAVLFQPMLGFFRRTANRLLYGERDDPYLTISKLGRRLEAALPSEEMLATIVQTVADSLKLPFVALRLTETSRDASGNGRVISLGSALAEPVAFPMLINNTQVGQLEVSPRQANEVFTNSEQRLLSDLANRAAVAVQQVQLIEALRQSREGLVLAREEERKRIRRDLHDGLGPTLVGVSFSLKASRMLLETDRVRVDELLASSSTQVEEAIADIRRLVDDLRPPALDDLGLLGAIRQRAEGFVSLRPSLEFEALPNLPAAVEVAAYRIVCEALNNAIKHARASSICVQVRMIDHGLNLEIQDDGVGLSNHRRDGAGLQTMRDRALELGGRFELQSVDDGTRVSAWLPVHST